MKILLINPPDNLSNFLGHGKQFVPVLEPLGLLSVAAVARKAGYDVEVLDAFAANLTIQDVKNYIIKREPDVVGMSSFVSNGAVIYEIGRWIKKSFPEIFVIFGNIHASVYAEAFLKNGCCDCVVNGEGEEVFLEVLQALELNKDLNIPALAILRNGSYIAAREQAVVENLAGLPLPDRDLVDQRLYNFPSMTNMPYSYRLGKVAKHMFTSRGCPFSCSFCVVQKKLGRRCYSSSQVLDEVSLLIQKYHTQYIFFMDPIFVYDKDRVIEICRLIKKHNIKFRWGCEGHINCIDDELICEMESAGCHDIAFGIESGAQHLLDNVHKGIRVDNIERCINLIKRKTKIKVSGLFILGLPGETPKDTLATIAFSKKLPLDMAQFSIFVPYPGSPVFYELAGKGEVDTALRKGGTLDVSVWQRYSSYISFTKNDPVWVTSGLTARGLKRMQKKAIRDFYFRPKQLFYQAQRFSLAQVPGILSLFKVAY